MSLRRISDIQQTPILDLETGDILGQILDWYVNPQQQRVVAYLVSHPTLWRKAKIIVPADIVEYGPKMVIVRDREALITSDEIVGLATLVADGMNLLGFRAETESGKLLGLVSDFVIEIVGGTIQQYEIKSPTLIGALQNNLLLAANQVVRVDQYRLVFPDSVLNNPQTIPQTQTQTI